MAISVQNITKNIAHGELYAFMDLPADGAAMALTNSVPNGAGTLHLGATQGESVGVFTPTIEGVDVEQLYGQIGYHMVREVAMIRATLVEPNLRNLEMVASQATRVNYLDNASFEGPGVGGIAEGWQSVGTITSPTLVTGAGDFHTGYGKQAQRFATGATAGGIQTPKLVHPHLVAGKILVFSTYAKVAAATPSLQLKIEAFNATDTSLGSNTSLTALSTTYSRAAVAFTLPANTAKVQVTAQDATGQSATWFLDNAQLEIVPSGSSPTGLVGPKALFLGGKTDVLTYPVALVWQQAGTPKYSWVLLYNCYCTGGLQITKQRGQPTRFPVEFTATPVPSRSAGDQYGQWVEQQ